MSTTAVSAGQVMDRVAALLNDPSRTDYTYAVILPYLNMAIEELSETSEEYNNSPSQSSFALTLLPGGNSITPAEDTVLSTYHYPDDLTEVQEVRTRPAGTTGMFIPLPKRESRQTYPQGTSLIYWYWENQIISFNAAGANVPIDVLVTYVRQGVPYVANELTMIGMINARSFLAFKTAALCARYIGENESRAEQLDGEADDALERTTTISNKGRQQIVTRHRPFRASYKRQGWF